MFLAFPEFNIYSTPLLILVVQGSVFGVLLLLRFSKQRNFSDLFLGLLILITCYHRTTYTIGFMAWYDTFRETKINYYLIYLGLAIGPLIYLYIRSVTSGRFRFKRRDWLHFLPVGIYIGYRLSIFGYDAAQPGFEDSQNGVLMRSLEMGFMGVFWEVCFILQHLLYLAFSLQKYLNYRRALNDFYSNTYKLELNWLRNILYLYCALFIYSLVQQFVIYNLVELSYIQKWWYQFFAALVVIYLGIKGYFTHTLNLKGLHLDFTPDKTKIALPLERDSLPKTEEFESLAKTLIERMRAEKLFLNPDLNLTDLASEMKVSRAKLSECINVSQQLNFNDFVNQFRIESFKMKIREGAHKQLSLLGVALECGFNSKATFYRAFKKTTHRSPTEFARGLDQI